MQRKKLLNAQPVDPALARIASNDNPRIPIFPGEVRQVLARAAELARADIDAPTPPPAAA